MLQGLGLTECFDYAHGFHVRRYAIDMRRDAVLGFELFGRDLFFDHDDQTQLIGPMTAYLFESDSNSDDIPFLEQRSLMFALDRLDLSQSR